MSIGVRNTVLRVAQEGSSVIVFQLMRRLLLIRQIVQVTYILVVDGVGSLVALIDFAVEKCACGSFYAPVLVHVPRRRTLFVRVVHGHVVDSVWHDRSFWHSSSVLQPQLNRHCDCLATPQPHLPLPVQSGPTALIRCGVRNGVGDIGDMLGMTLAPQCSGGSEVFFTTKAAEARVVARK